jgi:hypothetical protein
MEKNMNTLHKTRSSSWVADQGSAFWTRPDSRSALAMLAGNDDGRTKRYEKFALALTKQDPNLSLEQVNEAYLVLMSKKSWTYELREYCYSYFKKRGFALKLLRVQIRHQQTFYNDKR